MEIVFLTCWSVHAKDPVDKTWSEPPDIDMMDGDGRTPLHLACLHGQYDSVMTLLTIPKTLTTRPANPDLQDKLGRTALHYAAAGGNYEIVKVRKSLHQRRLLILRARIHLLMPTI